MPKTEKIMPEPPKTTPTKPSMTDFKCFKVKQAFAQSSILVPGAILNETTLTQAKVPGIKMTYTPMGLFVEAKNHTCIVPLANIKNVVLESE